MGFKINLNQIEECLLQYRAAGMRFEQCINTNDEVFFGDSPVGLILTIHYKGVEV